MLILGKQESQLKQKLADLQKETPKGRDAKKNQRTIESYMERSLVDIDKLKEFQDTLHCRRFNANGLIEKGDYSEKILKDSTV
jgi:hypothetical protein